MGFGAQGNLNHCGELRPTWPRRKKPLRISNTNGWKQDLMIDFLFPNILRKNHGKTYMSKFSAYLQGSFAWVYIHYDLEEFCFQATRIFLGHIATIDSASDIIPNCFGYYQMLVGEIVYISSNNNPRFTSTDTFLNICHSQWSPFPQEATKNYERGWLGGKWEGFKFQSPTNVLRRIGSLSELRNSRKLPFFWGGVFLRFMSLHFLHFFVESIRVGSVEGKFEVKTGCYDMGTKSSTQRPKKLGD